MYWASIYGHVLDLAARDPLVREATIFVRHEDLCAEPRQTIDRMLAHAELNPAGFGAVREQYAAALRQPRYYRAALANAELGDIEETTADVARRLGYSTAQTERRARRGLRVGQDRRVGRISAVRAPQGSVIDHTV